MATVASGRKSTSSDKEVSLAADFLRSPRVRGYKDADLRKYLIQKRRLSDQQVNEAFAIRQHIMKLTTGDGLSRQNGACKKLKIKQEDSAERPEKSISPQPRTGNVLTFLIPQKQEAGRKLIKEFLASEWNYCITLECLKNEYYAELAKLAGQRRLKIERSDIDKVFRHIPHQLQFHRSFYKDLSQGSNIGRMFVRLFFFFKGYTEYMKDCASTIEQMRQYTKDKKLHLCLEEIKSRSRRRKDDMTDLLLEPLNRIMDYRDFLNTLQLWADKSQLVEYEFLAKAARRIGRVAKYIEEYKYGIMNKNEMNKVQTFLGNQCEILSPHRRILRRGKMIRRTTGWPPRNKRYIFFLFNDVLVWTKSNGNLKNSVRLTDCIVMQSDDKYNAGKKFKILVSMAGREDKLLLLECTSEKERDEWYRALEGAISARGKSYYPENSDITNSCFDLKVETSSEEEKVQTEIARCIEDTLSKGNKNAIPKTQQNFENQPTSNYDTSVDTVRSQVMCDGICEESLGFIDQELKEFDKIDDLESQISEFDQEFYDKHSRYQKARYESIGMSPFVTKISSCYDSAGVATFRNSPRYSNSGYDNTYHEGVHSSKCKITRDDFKIVTRQFNHASGSGIIRRQAEKPSFKVINKLELFPEPIIQRDDGVKSFDAETIKLERSSLFSICLNDFDFDDKMGYI